MAQIIIHNHTIDKFIQQLHDTTIRHQTAINSIQATLAIKKTSFADMKNSINNIIHYLSEIATKLGFEITLPPPLPLSLIPPTSLPSILSPLQTNVPTSASAVPTTFLSMNNTATAAPSSEKKLFNNHLTQTQISAEINSNTIATTLLSSPTLHYPCGTTFTTPDQTIDKPSFVNNTDLCSGMVTFSPSGLASPLIGSTISLVAVVQDNNNTVIPDYLKMVNNGFLKLGVVKYTKDESVFTRFIQFLGFQSSLEPAETSLSTKRSNGTKIYIFDPGGMFNVKCFFSAEIRIWRCSSHWISSYDLEDNRFPSGW